MLQNKYKLLMAFSMPMNVTDDLGNLTLDLISAEAISFSILNDVRNRKEFKALHYKYIFDDSDSCKGIKIIERKVTIKTLYVDGILLFKDGEYK